MRLTFNNRTAVVLLEALIALALLGTAALALLSLSASDTRAVTRLIERSKEMNAASRFLDAVALWPREELDRRFGTRAQGAYLLRILRPSHNIYTLELLDKNSERPVLSTAVFRPDASK